MQKTVHRYKPWGAAKTAFECRESEILVSGPAGTGKSRGLLEKLNMVALLNPGMRGLIVRKTLVSLGSTALVTWRKFVIPELLATGDVYFYGGGPEEPAGYRYKNKSFIAIGGMDKPTKIMSSEYDIVYAQEATELTITDWEAITTRLRNWVMPFQQIIADCNPDIPTHWLKARCDRGASLMIESRHEDNPLLFDECGQVTVQGKAYIDKLDNLTGVRFLRLRRGIWAAAEGLVYENFDPAVNMIDHFDIPKSWPRFWAIDFGYKNPFVCQFWAKDPDGRLYLYREIYMTERLVEDHVRTIKQRVSECTTCCKSTESTHLCYDCPKCDCKWTEPQPSHIVADHDAEDRATFERHMGFSTKAAKKTVSDGVQAFDARLRVQPDGKPRLYFLRDAVFERDQSLEDRKLPCSSAEEIVGYVWDEGAGGKIKDAPKKEHDHGMDAGRYEVAEHDLNPEPGVRILRRRTYAS